MQKSGYSAAHTAGPRVGVTVFVGVAVLVGVRVMLGVRVVLVVGVLVGVRVAVGVAAIAVAPGALPGTPAARMSGM